MKYVRVCDEYENEYITTYQQHCEDVANMQDCGFDFEGCIIKQADTIEELCDEFVCEEGHRLLSPTWKKHNDEGYPIETYHEGIMNAFRNGFNCKDYHWFGAIWTDKGLIYVARMNEDGVLCLLG